MVWLAVAIGGGLGAMARHAVTAAMSGRYTSTFPAAIFLVNALGCLLIGVVAGVIAGGRVHVGELTRTFLVVGILGGFTTFSSFGLDTFTLIRGGQPVAALLNAVGQVTVGLIAVAIGFAAGRS